MKDPAPVPPLPTFKIPERDGVNVCVFPAAVIVIAAVRPVPLVVDVASVCVPPDWSWPAGPMDVMPEPLVESVVPSKVRPEPMVVGRTTPFASVRRSDDERLVIARFVVVAFVEDAFVANRDAKFWNELQKF